MLFCIMRVGLNKNMEPIEIMILGAAHTRAFVCQWLPLIYLLCTSPAEAGQWTRSTNVQLLTGSGYELGSDDRDILTFEQVNTFNKGDIFVFFDASLERPSNETTAYGEATLRLLLPNQEQITDKVHFLKSLYAATSFELGEENHSYLLGVGSSLDVPGFRYLNINLFLRKSYRDSVARASDVGGQVNLNWQFPFAVRSWHFTFEGHVDLAFSESGGDRPKHDNLNAAPRLLVDAGRLFGVNDSLFVGVEYQVWRHKFGIQGVHENVVQAMAKWVF